MNTVTPVDPGRLVVVGKVVSVYGIKGWVKVMSYTEPKENIFAYQPWYLSEAGIKAKDDQVNEHQLERLVVDDGRAQGQGLVAHIQGVDDREQARLYCQKEILVDKEQMPGLADGEYYWHQLVGLKVYSSFGDQEAADKKEQLLGTIRQMLGTGANDVMVVTPCEGSLDKRERLLPYLTGHYGIAVDLLAGKLVIDWDPEF